MSLRSRLQDCLYEDRYYRPELRFNQNQLQGKISIRSTNNHQI